jgi:hypothetical protein
LRDPRVPAREDHRRVLPVNIKSQPACSPTRER